LRQGLKFTDGTPLDADAVKAFFDRGKAQANSFVKDQLADVTGVTTDGPLHVTLHLDKPDYQIPYLVAGRTGAIPSPTAARKNLAGLSQWPVGAGPFKMVEFVPESHAYFVKNPDYWDAANIHIDRIELSVAPEPATLVAALSSGAVDVATLPPVRLAEAKAAGLGVTIAPSLSVRDASINLNRAPFTNPKVVEAFRYAFDRDELVKVLTKGVATPVHQPFPKGYFAFNPEVETLWHYDPARARALLAEAGYAPGQLSIVITTNTLQGADTAAELIQAQLGRVGVRSTIRIVPPGSSTWQSEVYIAKNAQLAVDGTIGRESPTQSLLADYGPAGIMNLSGPHASREFLDALDLVNATPLDDPRYQRRLWDAVKIAVQQSPSNYLYSSPSVIATRSRVKGLNVTPSQLRWEGVSVD
jgi:peptide/nickel transport system substrate-binding protein